MGTMQVLIERSIALLWAQEVWILDIEWEDQGFSNWSGVSLRYEEF